MTMTSVSKGEKAITEAIGAVEAMGCDAALTDAIILLQSAREKVTDFADKNWCMYCGYFNPPFSTFSTPIDRLCVQCDYENVHVSPAKFTSAPVVE
jgi:hypothetical protein